MAAKGLIAALWSVLGLLLLLGYAIWRLSQYTYESLQMSLGPIHWLVLVVFTLFMAHSEGYRGFQKSFSPRYAARTKYLYSHGTLMQCILAPLFSMGFFHAPRRRIFSILALTTMIVFFILAFRLIPQPWKGLLDAGVVVGLCWGAISTILFCLRAFSDADFCWDAEIEYSNPGNLPSPYQ
ncbi:MAG: hypothetical protein OXD44_06705 [Gammaproteobacteria bacterium]|nr:hypothetical protein [Gammaproteobacteria bacterium]MCY4313369.1 hypothetical protein [Gammaproteobacteria bacterium]